MSSVFQINFNQSSIFLSDKTVNFLKLICRADYKLEEEPTTAAKLYECNTYLSSLQ